MRNIFNLGLLLITVFSFNVFASVEEVTLMTLESGENIISSEQIKAVNSKTIELLDGRTINSSEVEYVEVTKPNGLSKIFEKGLFKIIKTNGARVSVGGDATGGG